MKPDYIENLTDEVNAAVEKVHDAFIKKVIKKHALPLLNKFQAKISFPVEVLYCNGSYWLSERGKTNDFHEALLTLAHERAGEWSTDKRLVDTYEKQIAETFPEMVEFYQLYYEFNGYHGNPLLADLKPTVKPRKNQKTALDKKLEYFSED
jgi:hypothetical protein